LGLGPGLHHCRAPFRSPTAIRRSGAPEHVPAAVSRQIGALEEDLGAELFERTPKGVLLTPAGGQFVAEARNILLLIEQARRNTSAAGRGDMGELTVGFTMCAAYSVVPILTRLYMAALPKVTLRMRELMPNALERDLKEGVIDLAITFPGSEAPDLQTQALLREPLNVVLPHEQNMKLAEEAANEIAIMGDKTWLRARSGRPRRTPGALHSGDIAANSVVTPRLPTSNRPWASLACL
jgi:DNA-binding transcriptional LysR family regulator